MNETQQAPGFEQLPRTLPIFPLPGALLLPNSLLPLNIFEPRYLAMTRDAMTGHRMIGMVQPVDARSNAAKPEVYRTGCAGKISAFSETEDGRYLITLAGVCRFRIEEELPAATPYRQVLASFDSFRDDLDGEDTEGVDRERLLQALHNYLTQSGLPADWSAIQRAPSGPLINSLSMICPFEPIEKQALLEAPSMADRAEIIIKLLEMSLPDGPGGGSEVPLQ